MAESSSPRAAANHQSAQGEFSDRRTDACSEAADSAKVIARSSSNWKEANVVRSGSGRRGSIITPDVGWSGTRRSSSSCSLLRIRRARESDCMEPIPAIPQMYLDHPHPTSTSTSSTAPVDVSVTRTRRTERSGEPIPLPTSRSLSRGRERANKRQYTTDNAVFIVGPASSVSVSAEKPDFKRRQPPLQTSHARLSPTMPRSVASDIFLDDHVAREKNHHQMQSITPQPFPPQQHLHRRSLSRTSYLDKRRSLPPELMPRPSTSGGNPRPSQRLQHVSRASTDLQRHMDQYNNGQPSRPQNDDSSSFSHVGRRRGLAAMQERSPMSPRSPEVPQYGRRRPSFGVVERPKDDTSEQKQGESASGDSQSVDTVWDELDDLKSRIKKLELTGKLPTTSSAAVSGGSSDRPRTATTAPTTIDSSPKRDGKQEPPTPQTLPPLPTPETPTTPAGAGMSVANIHPLLHNALAKAKPLLNSNLFRSLEATANDALQLAAMTGSAGPQGTTFSAASIINGVTVSDRHVRRKADNMCRNLTDLCLALCEGKHEAPTAFSSPSTIDPVIQCSPSLRYARTGLGSASNTRPASRLEARRSSILGAPPSAVSDISPRGSIGDISAYDQEQSPPQGPSPQSYLQAPLRASRAPTTRLRSSRLQSHGDLVGGNEDEDSTVRPLSRAMTDAGSFRARPRIVSESRTPGPGQHHQRQTTLRDSLPSSPLNEDSYEQNRATSYGGAEQQRFLEPTPTQRKRVTSQFYQQRNSPATVTEEQREEGEDDNPTLGGTEFSSRFQQRRNTSQQYASSRRAGELQRNLGGGGGLQQRRHLALE